MIADRLGGWAIQIEQIRFYVGFGEGATGELFIVEIGGRVVQVVPEPASVVLMLAGAAVLLGWRARSR